MRTPVSGCNHEQGYTPYNHSYTPNSALAETLDRVGNNFSANQFQSKKTDKSEPIPKGKKSEYYRKKIYKLRREIGKEIHRVRPCGQYIRKDLCEVNLCQGHERGNYYFSNLMTCKSVWSCPHCSLKIVQERAKQIRDICANAQKDNKKVVHCTFTMPHARYQTCEELRFDITKGFSSMLATRKYQKIKKAYGLEGYIKALEVTWNDKNGWHPHFHVLFFFDGNINDSDTVLEACEYIFDCWQNAIRIRGGGLCSRDAFEARNVYDGEDISEYISKWDMSKELTEGNVTKRSRGDSLTPFQVFERYLETKDAKYLNLFKEYHVSFTGTKFLTFSRGLKKKYLNMVDKSDEEICQDEEGTVVLSMNKELWQEVVYFGYEANILNIMDSGGLSAVREFLEYFGAKYDIRGDVLFYYLDST